MRFRILALTAIAACSAPRPQMADVANCPGRALAIINNESPEEVEIYAVQRASEQVIENVPAHSRREVMLPDSVMMVRAIAIVGPYRQRRRADGVLVQIRFTCQ